MKLLLPLTLLALSVGKYTAAETNEVDKEIAIATAKMHLVQLRASKWDWESVDRGDRATL